MAFIELIVLLFILAVITIVLAFGIREKNRLMASQLRLEQVRFINDPKVDSALTEILWVWEWEDFDEYWGKYSPRNNPVANNTRRIARNYYIALASMVRKGDLDIGLLYELNPSGVTRYWEKIGPIAYEFRKRNNYPDYLEPVEYLANMIKDYRDRRGIQPPGKVN